MGNFLYHLCCVFSSSCTYASHCERGTFDGSKFGICLATMNTLLIYIQFEANDCFLSSSSEGSRIISTVQHFQICMSYMVDRLNMYANNFQFSIYCNRPIFKVVTKIKTCYSTVLQV